MRPLIVLAADAELRSDRALPVVAALALANRAQVLAIHVHDDGRDARTRSEADALAARAAWTLGQFGIETAWETVTNSDGQVASVIAGIARARHASLVALGSHAHGSLGGLFLGSVSHQVLALVDCQVLIAGGLDGREPLVPAEISRILVAADRSLESAAALTAVEPLALALRARVLVIHVSDVRTGNGETSRLQLEDSTRALVRRASNDLRLSGVRAEWTIPAGSHAVPARIAEAAREWQADLIVMGSRRHGELASVLVGSVVHRLGQLTARPILVAERPARKVPAADEEHNGLRQLVALGEA